MEADTPLVAVKARIAAAVACVSFIIQGLRSLVLSDERQGGPPKDSTRAKVGKQDSSAGCTMQAVRI